MIQFVARMLGGEKTLTSEDVAKLRAISVASYGKDFSQKPACEVITHEPEDEITEEEFHKILVEVKKRLNQSA